MGKLVQFEPRGEPRTDREPPAHRTAEIVLFTGIRYERSPQASPTKPPAPSRSKRKRG